MAKGAALKKAKELMKAREDKKKTPVRKFGADIEKALTKFIAKKKKNPELKFGKDIEKALDKFKMPAFRKKNVLKEWYKRAKASRNSKK